MSIKENFFLQVLYFGLIACLISCIVACTKAPDASPPGGGDGDEQTILDDAQQAIDRATTGSTNIFTGAETLDSPKGGGGGG